MYYLMHSWIVKVIHPTKTTYWYWWPGVNAMLLTYLLLNLIRVSSLYHQSLNSMRVSSLSIISHWTWMRVSSLYIISHWTRYGLAVYIISHWTWMRVSSLSIISHWTRYGLAVYLSSVVELEYGLAVYHQSLNSIWVSSLSYVTELNTC